MIVVTSHRVIPVVRDVFYKLQPAAFKYNKSMLDFLVFILQNYYDVSCFGEAFNIFYHSNLRYINRTSRKSYIDDIFRLCTYCSGETIEPIDYEKKYLVNFSFDSTCGFSKIKSVECYDND